MLFDARSFICKFQFVHFLSKTDAHKKEIPPAGSGRGKITWRWSVWAVQAEAVEAAAPAAEVCAIPADIPAAGAGAAFPAEAGVAVRQAAFPVGLPGTGTMLPVSPEAGAAFPTTGEGRIPLDRALSS